MSRLFHAADPNMPEEEKLWHLMREVKKELFAGLILPYYVKTYLSKLSGFTGIFIAAVVSAATSTISSIINSQAAVLYMDVLSPHIDNAKLHFKWVARGTAFLLGVVMTACSCACLYMGTITRLIIMMLSAFTGPFVGLMILAISFPFVHAKGAGISTLLMIGFQLVVVWQSLQSGTKPPPMPVTLEYCPENIGTLSNITTVLSTPRPEVTQFRLSSFWSSLISTCATVILGVFISVATGEHKKPTAQPKHLNQSSILLWKKMGLSRPDTPIAMENVQKESAKATASLLDAKEVSKAETAT
ncbi:sodium-coupled monocarboxylate transporter 2-like [Rhipicephalus microplus]|uniref:sodium-coupled monocarboxylate transporter 2-like n=1 Tax=Rhipicephalus microplus TaxID=6941 RepID=UPI003F6CD0DD